MKIKFLSPVNAGTELYAVGDTADLPHAQAKELIVCGAAEQYDPAAAKAMAKAEADAKAAAELEAHQAVVAAEQAIKQAAELAARQLPKV